MTRFAVDLEMLDQLIDRLAQFSTRLESLGDDVDARVRRVQAVWSGQAAAEGLDAHRLWAGNAAEMQNALATMRTISATARANYCAAVTANAQMWSG